MPENAERWLAAAAELPVRAGARRGAAACRGCDRVAALAGAGSPGLAERRWSLPGGAGGPHGLIPVGDGVLRCAEAAAAEPCARAGP